MSGKLIVAVVAAAVSSASAATVGVVFTRVIHPRHVEASASASAPAPGPVKSAVVLNASESLFDPPAGDSSSESDVPGCSTPGGAQHCAAAPHGSDVRLNILGSSLTIFPIWLGGDSEDLYAGRNNLNVGQGYAPAEPVEFFARVGRHRLHSLLPPSKAQSDANADDQIDAQSQEQSSSDGGSQGASSQSTRTDGGSSLLTNAGVSPGPDFQVAGSLGGKSPRSDLPIVVPLVLDPLKGLAPIDVPNGDTAPPILAFAPDGGAPSTQPLIPPLSSPPFLGPNGPGGGNVSAPEPSTWAMMIIGALALCALKRRRILAALQPARS